MIISWRGGGGGFYNAKSVIRETKNGASSAEGIIPIRKKNDTQAQTLTVHPFFTCHISISISIYIYIYTYVSMYGRCLAWP